MTRARKALRRVRKRQRGARKAVSARWKRSKLRHARSLKRTFGTPWRADLHAWGTWRGERPRIALRNYFDHPAWWTYRTHPPLTYAPSVLAKLDHWVDLLPDQVGPGGEIGSSRRAKRRLRRPQVLEVEHWSALVPSNAERWKLFRWDLAVEKRSLADDRVRADECKAVLTCSRGLVDHFRHFLAEDVWPKLDYVFPAFPSQPPGGRSTNGTFTILTIGNRLSDKGIPEALRAFEILRERHGARVRMVLVSGRIRKGYPLPEGVTICKTARMGADLKRCVYLSADVLVVPTYGDSIGNFTEGCAFGVPAVATRIHHGDDFVRDGESGFLIDSPLCAYSEDYGTRWRSWAEFMAEIERMRESGGLDGVVEDLVDRLEPMVSGDVDLDELRRGARRLHSERFSPEVRNAKLREIYARALEQ